ncbi:hypothetical protein K2X33_04065 [bacterium]|nr:hypothetical protein [bacterium]
MKKLVLASALFGFSAFATCGRAVAPLPIQNIRTLVRSAAPAKASAAIEFVLSALTEIQILALTHSGTEQGKALAAALTGIEEALSNGTLKVELLPTAQRPPPIFVGEPADTDTTRVVKVRQNIREFFLRNPVFWLGEILRTMQIASGDFAMRAYHTRSAYWYLMQKHFVSNDPRVQRGINALEHPIDSSEWRAYAEGRSSLDIKESVRMADKRELKFYEYRL